MIECQRCQMENPHEVWLCPEHKGEAVCKDCHYNCQYCKEDKTCGWYIVHPIVRKPDLKKKRMYELEKEIENLQYQAEKYYHRSKPMIGDKIVFQINKLKAELKEVEAKDEEALY